MTTPTSIPNHKNTSEILGFMTSAPFILQQLGNQVTENPNKPEKRLAAPLHDTSCQNLVLDPLSTETGSGSENSPY